ncbi:MAG: biphenyl 2,3-dioxygenase [Gammaproteobacteria bacterium]|nr:biphenyl 2,3-dioxygenase [Gammaproteobacteria bacterium]
MNIKTRSGLLLALLLLVNTTLKAAGDYTSQAAIEKTVMLGSDTNQLRFYPSTLSFETGKLYKLVIKNPSPQKHYFSASEFSRSIFTRKVQVMSQQNAVIAEVKGNIHELEVYPGGTTEWWFVALKTLTHSALHCSIAGHREAGMRARISIK